MKNTNLIKSFIHAACGFADAFKRERNLRIHLSFANLVLVFAAVYGLDRNGFGILILTVTAVIFAELMNSAVEKAVDTATSKYRFDAGHAKDFGAAATLVSAIGAVCVGIALFGDLKRIRQACIIIFTSPLLLTVFVILLAVDVLMIMYPKFIKRHRKRKEI